MRGASVLLVMVAALLIARPIIHLATRPDASEAARCH